jgi:dipeptidyl aminopeptidase/acylaminoacyl peptidase
MLVLLLASGTALAQPAPAPAAAQAPSLQALFREPALKSATLSPTGTHVALVLGEAADNDRLVVIDLASMKPTLLLLSDGMEMSYVTWSSERRLVYILQPPITAASDMQLGGKMAAIDFDGSNRRDNFSRAYVQRLLTRPGPRPNEVFGTVDEATGRGEADYTNLYTVDTVSGHRRDVDTPRRSTDWVFDSSGEILAATRRDGTDTVMMVRAPGGSWRDVHRNGLLNSNAIYPQHITPLGELIVTSNIGREHFGLFTFDVTRGKLADKPILSSDRFDIDARFVETRGELVGIHYLTDRPTTLWLKPELQQLQARVDAALPGQFNRIHMPPRPATDFMLVRSSSSTQPDQWFVLDAKSGKITARLGNALPEVNARALAPTRLVQFKARDGMDIPAWLTLPRDLPAGGPPPLVVLVHGGPWVRGSDGDWDSEVQFLASRGYAVLQPEFRGSAGFGRTHFSAGVKQWGLSMQTDLEDAARWAVSQGHADAKRVCIAGASYGGYAALMGVATQGDTFRCAVSWVGPTDLPYMFVKGVGDASEVARRFGMPQLVGDPKADADQLRRTSPANLASQIKRPVLLAYGQHDWRVPIEHGERMRDALERAGNPAQWILYRDEAHGWSKAANRVDFWGKVERFLDVNLKNAR